VVRLLRLRGGSSAAPGDGFGGGRGRGHHMVLYHLGWGVCGEPAPLPDHHEEVAGRAAFGGPQAEQAEQQAQKGRSAGCQVAPEGQPSAVGLPPQDRSQARPGERLDCSRRPQRRGNGAGQLGPPHSRCGLGSVLLSPFPEGSMGRSESCSRRPSVHLPAVQRLRAYLPGEPGQSVAVSMCCVRASGERRPERSAKHPGAGRPFRHQRSGSQRKRCLRSQWIYPLVGHSLLSWSSGSCHDSVTLVCPVCISVVPVGDGVRAVRLQGRGMVFASRGVRALHRAMPGALRCVRVQVRRVGHGVKMYRMGGQAVKNLL